MFRPRLERLGKCLRAALKLAAVTARAAAGVGDYEAYLRHQRAHRPGEVPLSRAAFFRQRQEARYRRGATRCC